MWDQIVSTQAQHVRAIEIKASGEGMAWTKFVKPGVHDTSYKPCQVAQPVARRRVVPEALVRAYHA